MTKAAPTDTPAPDAPKAKGAAMGITRYMRILDLFGPAHPVWSVAEISAALDTSASTLYRLVREMVAVGLLEGTVESRYRLGPLFIEYDRRLRLTDPLIRSGATFLEPLVAQVGLPCSAILARLHGGKVMCVAERRHPDAMFQTSYERGHPMPLARGATSLAVLSTLPKRQVLALLGDAGTSPLMTQLTALRKQGILITSGHVDQGLTGIAAPVHNRALGIHASLSVIIETHLLTQDGRARLATAVATAARMIEGFMDNLPPADG